MAVETKGAPSEAELRAKVAPIRPSYEWAELASDEPWVVIHSRLFGETILLVLQQDRLRDAEAMYPGLVVYLLPEMDLLREFEEDPEVLRRLHRIKKAMDGWIVRRGTRVRG